MTVSNLLQIILLIIEQILESFSLNACRIVSNPYKFPCIPFSLSSLNKLKFPVCVLLSSILFVSLLRKGDCLDHD